MNMWLKILSLTIIFNLATNVMSAKSTDQNAVVSYQVFYDELSPYGYWVDYPSYGYVWVPNVSPGFTPYSTGGHWVYTNYGWTWASDYKWGWAPFHYGRWDYDSFYGWVWVPSYEWGPAWVSWRHADGYYGWAPLGPNVTVVQSFRGYEIPADRWRFVRERDINRTDIHRYYVNRNQNATYLRNSTIINNTYADNSRGTTYIYGPRKADVQKVTNTKINPLIIRDNSRPGARVSGNKITMYRPRIQQTSVEGPKPVPATITTREGFSARTPAANNSVNSRPGSPASNQQTNPLLRPKTQTSTSGNPLLKPKTGTNSSSVTKKSTTTKPRVYKGMSAKPSLSKSKSPYVVKPKKAKKQKNNPLLSPKQVSPAPRRDNTIQQRQSVRPPAKPLLKNRPGASGNSPQNPIITRTRPTPAPTSSGNPLLRPRPAPAPAPRTAPPTSGNPLLRPKPTPAPAPRTAPPPARSGNPLLQPKSQTAPQKSSSNPLLRESFSILTIGDNTVVS